MTVAKYLLLAVLFLPAAEIAAFIAVAASIGFLWALALIAAGSFAGALILRHAGGNHIARMRVAMADGSFTALRADSIGTSTLLAGFLLLIPGFITDVIGLLVLARGLGGGAAVRRGPSGPPPDGVVDLEPEQWRRVPDTALPRRDRDGRDGNHEDNRQE